LPNTVRVIIALFTLVVDVVVDICRRRGAGRNSWARNTVACASCYVWTSISCVAAGIANACGVDKVFASRANACAGESATATREVASDTARLAVGIVVCGYRVLTRIDEEIVVDDSQA
jgi:hypothetical protein